MAYIGGSNFKILKSQADRARRSAQQLADESGQLYYTHFGTDGRYYLDRLGEWHHGVVPSEIKSGADFIAYPRKKANPTNRQIASIILEQISALSEGDWKAAMSKRDFVALPEDTDFQGGVQFTLKGLGGPKGKFHKVVIKLTWRDDYTMELWEFDKHDHTQRKLREIEMIYADQLASSLLDFWEEIYEGGTLSPEHDFMENPENSPITAYGVIRGRDWQQEWYDTKSGDARRRASELRRLGFKVAVDSGSSQVTSVGRVNMTLLSVMNIPGDIEVPSPDRVERL